MPIKSVNRIYRLSWVAYVYPLIVLASVYLAAFYLPSEFFNFVYPVLVWVVYRIVYLSQVKLFTNESGIWLTGGLFPWQRFGTGIRWQNADKAFTGNGFFVWFFGSYPVSVTNRYTKSREIYLRHVYQGYKFVAQVNHYIHQYHGSNMRKNQAEVANKTFLTS